MAAAVMRTMASVVFWRTGRGNSRTETLYAVPIMATPRMVAFILMISSVRVTSLASHTQSFGPHGHLCIAMIAVDTVIRTNTRIISTGKCKLRR